ncbi:hypothetical protein BSKO_02384 [Bryopsis sp. KO-2023]|nr:hypothetical protein BSKO_02384 [Bryopsis sp. KO-2023]
MVDGSTHLARFLAKQDSLQRHHATHFTVAACLDFSRVLYVLANIHLALTQPPTTIQSAKRQACQSEYARVRGIPSSNFWAQLFTSTCAMGSLGFSLIGFGLLLLLCPIAAFECKIEPGTTYLEKNGRSRNVIKSKGKESTLTKSSLECMDKCFENKDCAAWTRITYPQKLANSHGRSVGECWLLRNSEVKLQKEKNGCCSSGRAEKCTSMDNTDFQGKDLNDGHQEYTCSFEECREKCKNWEKVDPDKRKCKSWTWVKQPRQLMCPSKPDTKTRTYGECWLKREYFPTRGVKRHKVGKEKCCVSGNMD